MLSCEPCRQCRESWKNSLATTINVDEVEAKVVVDNGEPREDLGATCPKRDRLAGEDESFDLFGRHGEDLVRSQAVKCDAAGITHRSCLSSVPNPVVPDISMNTLQFPFYVSNLPFRDQPETRITAVLFAHPDHRLSQAEMFPNIHLYHHINTRHMDLITPGYYRTGYEPDQTLVSVADGKAWFFSPSVYDGFASRFSRFGWKGFEEPELVLMDRSRASASVNLLFVADHMSVHDLVGNLIKLTEEKALAEKLASCEVTMRQLLLDAMIPELGEIAVSGDLRLIRVVESTQDRPASIPDPAARFAEPAT